MFERASTARGNLEMSANATEKFGEEIVNKRRRQSQGRGIIFTSNRGVYSSVYYPLAGGVGGIEKTYFQKEGKEKNWIFTHF